MGYDGLYPKARLQVRSMVSSPSGVSAPSQFVRASRLDLSRSRECKSISLEEIAEKTKISLRFLRAIEDEEFEKLPGGIFNTSYLRQYAVAAGYDAEQLLNHYNQTVNRVAVRQSPKAEQRGLLNRWLGPVQAQH
jgi:hypothetical protein